MKHVEGTVVVRAMIDSAGRPDRNSIEVLESSNQRLNDAAKEFVANSTYHAGKVEGKKVTMPVEVPVQFQLR
jgi:TonB family protein